MNAPVRTAVVRKYLAAISVFSGAEAWEMYFSTIFAPFYYGFVQ